MLVILSFTAPPLPPPPPKAFLILSFRPISAPLKPPGLSSPSPASPSPSASPLSWDLSRLIAARKSPPLAVTSVRRSANPETRCDAASAARCTSKPNSCCPASFSASVGNAEARAPFFSSRPSLPSAITAPLSSAGGPTGGLQPRPCRPAAPGHESAFAPHRQRRYHPHRYWPGGARAAASPLRAAAGFAPTVTSRLVEIGGLATPHLAGPLL